MAIAPVQVAHNSANGSNPLTCQYGSNVGTGNLLICAFQTRQSVSSVTDDGGRTWTQQITDAIGFSPGNQYFYTAPVGTGGTKPTVSVAAGGSFVTMFIGELSGTDVTSSPLSTSAAAHQGPSGTNVPVGPTGTSGASEFAVAVGFCDGGDNVTADGAWTAWDAEATNNLKGAIEYLAVNSTTASTTFTIASSNFAGGMIAVFKNGGGGGGGSPSINYDFSTPRIVSYPFGNRTSISSAMQATVNPVFNYEGTAAKASPYPQALRTSTVNLQPLVAPIPAGIQTYELPTKPLPTPIERRTWTQNAGYMVERVPTPTTYDLPTKPRPHPQELRTWVQDLDHFVEPIPAGKNIYDVPNRLPPFWWDLRTWIQDLDHFVEPTPRGQQSAELPTKPRPTPQQLRTWLNLPQTADVVVTAALPVNYDFSLTPVRYYPVGLRTWTLAAQIADVAIVSSPLNLDTSLPVRFTYPALLRTWLQSGGYLSDANLAGAREYALPNRAKPTPMEVRTWIQNLTHYVEPLPDGEIIYELPKPKVYQQELRTWLQNLTHFVEGRPVPQESFDLPPKGTVFPNTLRTWLLNLGLMVEAIGAGDNVYDLPTKPRPYPQDLRTWLQWQLSADVIQIIAAVGNVFGWDIPISRGRGADVAISRAEGYDTPTGRSKGRSL